MESIKVIALRRRVGKKKRGGIREERDLQKRGR